jgi:hypothetical protein
MAQVAQDLHELGYTDLVSVTPPGAKLAASSKLPASQLGKIPGVRRPDGYWVGYDWRSKKTYPAAIDRNGANIGILATRFPGLDIDSENPALTLWALHIAEDVLGWAPVRLSREPRRLLMYAADVPIRKQKLLVRYEGVDHAVELLGDGQQYLIWGTHPSGTRYRWSPDAKIPSDGPAGLTLIDDEKVDRYFHELAGYLEERGCEILSEASAREVPQVPGETTEGTGRNVMLTSLAGTMRRRGMGYEAILAALQAENDAKCVPPLDQDELEVIAGSVSKYEPEKVEVVDATQVFKPVKVEEKTFVPAFTTRKADNAMSLEYDPTDWLVGGLIPRLTGYTMLNSKPKVGKSTFARALAVAVSNGEPILGRPTVQVPVMYVSFPFEGDEEQTAISLKKIGKPAPNLWISGKWERSVSRDQVIQTLIHYAQEVKPGLIIIDTVMKLLRMKDVKDYAEVQDVLAPLYHVLEPYGCHFLFLHHEKKGGVEDVIESGLGSIGLAGSAETVLRITRDPDLRTVRVLDGVGRQAGDIDPRILLMDETTGWPSLGPHPDAHKAKELVAQLAAQMGEMGEDATLTQEECRQIMGGRRDEVIRWLRTSDLVEQIGTGVRGDPFKYRLVKDGFNGEEIEDADGPADDEE